MANQNNPRQTPDNSNILRINRRKFVKLSGSGAIAASVAGCIGDESEITGDEESITITQGPPIEGLDPHNHSHGQTWNVLYSHYEDLLYNNPFTGEIEPLLATDWEIEEDLITFELREGITFHNGEAMTAEDVEYSINRIVDSDIDGTLDRAASFPTVDEAVATDEHTVEVHLNTVDPLIAQRFGGNGEIICKSWAEERSASEIAQEVNGTGPYELDEYEIDERVVQTVYDDYWGETPEIPEVVWSGTDEDSTRVSMLLSDETDFITSVPFQDISRIEDEDGVKVETVATDRNIGCFMRYDVEPFSSQEFRQAMNYAVDLDELIDNLFNGEAEPLGQLAPTHVTGHNPDIDPYPYDPDQAEDMVEESGHSGADITLHTPVGRYVLDTDVAQAVAGYIDDLDNVSCDVEQRDFGSFSSEISTENIEDKPPFYLLGLGLTPPDAIAELEYMGHSEGTYSTANSEELDELIEQAQGELDEDTRLELLHEANQVAHEYAPKVFLYQQPSVIAMTEELEFELPFDEDIFAYNITRN